MKNLKNSGIEWLGEIPEHWEVVKIKYFANLYNGDSIKDSDKGKYCIADNDTIPYIATKDIDIIFNSINYYNGMFIKRTDANFKKAYKECILLCIEGANAGKKIAILNQEVCFVNKLCCVKNKSTELNSKFLFYFFQGIFFQNIFFSNIKGLIGGVTPEQIGNFLFLLPPLKEQVQIANFLDEKCEKIQNFIEKKEKLLSLLQEQKQALINETITKGLDKNVKLKNSGIEWLGEIPEHWEMVRLANFGIFLKGNGISRQDLIEDGEPAIHYGDIYTKYEISTTALKSRISTETAQNITSIHNGDILFAGSGETKEDIGKNIVYLGKEKAFAGGDVIIFRQKKNNALFLSYALNTKYVKSLKGIDSKGEIIVHIYASNLKDIKIPIPPLKEQEQIANFLDEKCEKIDSLITKIKKQIELIKEYKTTLINEAVCGRMNL
ncbi:restriction endonuclease subunit S [Campylobacter sp. RM10541]|uniref:restriction endonuclease subunit S n=1 Tax=Campylobacter molothri TaxID=1032242 RepID=UPI001D696BFC|nr:restriction endonuclease subunit S [Campylobacter sp. RM10536]MBZ7956356.1 restriction endonuclease subunit S [Campylobacter sp. RM10541]